MENIEWTHLKEALERYGEYLVTRYQTYVPEASGKLVQSAHYEVKINDSVFEVGIWLEDYFKYVENGRGAGKFPPIDKIKEWIRVKPIIPRPMKNGKLPTENQLAYLIGRKIAKEGYEGKHPLEKSIEDVNQEMLMTIKMAIMEDIADDLNKTLITLTNLK